MKSFIHSHQSYQSTSKALLVILALSLASLGYAQNTISRVSVSSSGEQANGYSDRPAISADGRYVVFESSASNLVPNDTNESSDIFIHDLDTGQTSRVSVNSSGEQAKGSSYDPSISADGRFVTFVSRASNLVIRDRNNKADIFVHDRETGKTSRVSVMNLSNLGGNDISYGPSISADGRYVVFQSDASNLVAGDWNRKPDVFVHDRERGLTTRVNVNSSGGQTNEFPSFTDEYGLQPSISADGKLITFASRAMNLVDNDSEFAQDIFVHNRETGQTKLVSVNSRNEPGNSSSYKASISADGRYVAFESYADNLVVDDENRNAIFVRDLFMGETKKITRSDINYAPHFNFITFSFDGRYIAYISWYEGAYFLGQPEEGNGLFVYDQVTRKTETIISMENTIYTTLGGISKDGRRLVISSRIRSLVPNDTNQATDIFVVELGGDGSGEKIPNVSGTWYDRSTNGLGFNVIETSNDQLLAYFYGYTNEDGNAQWLLTDALSVADVEQGKTYTLPVYTGFDGNGGSFTSAPVTEQSGLTEWGSLELTFNSCDSATARLTGTDGTMSFDMIKLANVKGSACSGAETDEALFNVSGTWYDRSEDGLGFNVVNTPNNQLLAYFYGYKGGANGDTHWLLSDALPVNEVTPGETYMIDVYTGYDGNGGTFTTAPTVGNSGIRPWGSLAITFDSCTSARATLSGEDGEKSFNMIKLANLKGKACSE